MAVIRLQLELDPALQPELHQLLEAIHDEGARAERLRQLATTGLLWEGLRLQALAAGRLFIEAPGLGDLHADRPQEPADPWPELAAHRLVEAAAEGLTEPPAHEALSLAEADGPVAPAAGTDALPASGQACAVSLDASAWSGPLQPSEVQIEGSAADEAFQREIDNTMRQLPVLTEVIDPTDLHTQPQALPAAPGQRTATRSRLLRMKEKGLFRNE